MILTIKDINFEPSLKFSIFWTEVPHPYAPDRGQPNPNNLAESEYIRNRIVPFLINRIGNKTIRIRFLISRIGICSIRIRFLINRIGICSIPYKPNINRIFEMVKTIINHM